MSSKKQQRLQGVPNTVVVNPQAVVTPVKYDTNPDNRGRRYVSLRVLFREALILSVLIAAFQLIFNGGLDWNVLIPFSFAAVFSLSSEVKDD